MLYVIFGRKVVDIGAKIPQEPAEGILLFVFISYMVGFFYSHKVNKKRKLSYIILTILLHT